MNYLEPNNIILEDSLYNLDCDFDIYPCGNCPYGYNFENSIRAFRYSGNIGINNMENLISSGYRRCGDLYYRNECSNCQACLPIRIPINRFSLSKSQKRVLKKNKPTVCIKGDLNFSDEKFKIYKKYQLNRHKEENYTEMDLITIINDQMLTDSGATFELQFFCNDKLCGFMTVDKGTETLSAVYSVYDIDLPENSLGTFFILSLIDFARENNYEYVNLGYFIPNCRKMNYKSKFKPFEIFDINNQKWIEYNE